MCGEGPSPFNQNISLSWPNWPKFVGVFPALNYHLSLLDPWCPCLAFFSLCKHSRNMSSNKIWIYDEIPLKLLRNTRTHTLTGRRPNICLVWDKQNAEGTGPEKGGPLLGANKYTYVAGLNTKKKIQKTRKKIKTKSRSSIWDQTEWQNTRNNVIWWYTTHLPRLAWPGLGPPNNKYSSWATHNFVWLPDTDAKIQIQIQ